MASFATIFAKCLIARFVVAVSQDYAVDVTEKYLGEVALALGAEKKDLRKLVSKASAPEEIHTNGTSFELASDVCFFRSCCLP